MGLMNQPVQNMNPAMPGFGQYVSTNIVGGESNMRSPPGKEIGGSMTPI